MTELTLRPGLYWLGDPCYVQDRDSGDFQLEYAALFPTNDPSTWNDTFCVDGKVGRFAGSSTKYGDGDYPYGVGPAATFVKGNCERLSVDSGVIGAVPVGPLNEAAVEANLDLGAVVEFHHPFTVEFDRPSGEISVGPVTVWTDWQADEVDEDEDDPWGDSEEEDEEL